MTGKKVLALILSITLVASTSAMRTVKAEAVSLDSIYANAYKATVDATASKTQKSINTAREAIKLLPKNLDWAIGEFSKQVDRIQQPIFEKAYNAIQEAQKTPNQANINAAKAAIDTNMPEYYRNSYSSAADKVQQEYMKKAEEAYKKAVQSKLQGDFDAANLLLVDIRTSTNQAISNWVDLVQGLGDIKDLNDGGTHVSNYAIYSDSGSFGATDSSKPTTIKGNLLLNNINGTSVTLQNMNIEGILSVNFGAGNVVLNNVKVNGVTVTNVGSKSLHVIGSSVINNLNVQDSNNDAHIVIEGNANVINANVLSGAALEVAPTATNAKPFGNVTVAGTNLPSANNRITLKGTFDIVVISTPNTIVDLQGASVGTFAISKEATGSRINTSNDAVINTLNINAPIAVTGSGAITTANIGISGTTIESKPANISVVSGVTATVAGQTRNDSNSTVIKGVPEVNVPPVVVNPPVVTPPSGGGGGYVTPSIDLKQVKADDAVTISLKSSINNLAFTINSTKAGARDVAVSSQTYENGVYILKLNAPLTTDAEYKITAAKSGFNSAVDSVTSKMAYKYITNADELDNAITNQKDNENWIIKSGNYDVKSKYRFDIDSTGDNGYNRYYFPIKASHLNIIGINNPVIYSTDLTLNGVRATQNFISVYGNKVTIDGIKIMTKLGANKAIEIMGDKGGQNFTLKNSSILRNTLTSYNGTDKVSDYFGKLDILYPDELEFAGSIYFNGDVGNSSIENVRIENGGISFRAATSKITFNNVTIDNSTATYAWIKNYKYSVKPDAEVKGLETIKVIGSETKGDIIVTQRPFVNGIVTVDGIKYYENYDAFNSVEKAIANAASKDIIYIEPGTYYYTTEKAPTAPTGVTMLTEGVTFVHTDKVISTARELTDAIANQADRETWVIKAGTYDLPRGTKIIQGQDGWYFPITASNLTIIGDGNPTITSSVPSPNGAWASQNLITVFGDNVKISGVTLKTKEEANKVIEVIGDKFVLDGATINPNTYNFAGSIYFSNPGKTATISNTVLNYGRISGLTGATGATINLNNVEINFAGATDNDPTDNNIEKALWAYYRDNSKENAATVNATNLKVTMSNAMGSDLQDAINMLPSGTTVVLKAGTYYNLSGKVPTTPEGVNITATGAEFIKADKVINNVTELKDAIKNQADDQTWVIKAGTYDIPNDITTLRDIDGKIVTSGGQAGWYFPITANNLTIIGIGNPVITSSTVTENGIWSSQSLIAVWGDNVKLDGLTITPKVQVNKSIEVIGDKQFTVENCKFTPNTIATGALPTKGGSLYFNGVGATGNKAILVKDNTFNYTTVAFDGVEGSDITITGNTFENIADGAYAIGNTYWGSAERKTTQYADVKINGNNFNNVIDTTKIIAARLNQTFILDASNKINGAPIDKNNFGNYINFNNLAYWAECKLNKVVVDDVTYTNVTAPIKIPVTYYTGIGFTRSNNPIVNSNNGKIVNQEIKADGSVGISVTSPDNTYLDAGFVMEVGTLGELGSIEVHGTGDYGLNLYFDLDGNGFFQWKNDGTFDNVGGDRYALYNESHDSTISINGSSNFGLQGTLQAGEKYENTLNELKAKYPANTPVGIWVGVTRGGNESAGTKSAVINSITVAETAPPDLVTLTAQDFGTWDNGIAFKGLNVGFSLGDNFTTMKNIKSMVVDLYAGEQKLATNTAKMTEWQNLYPTAKQCSTPFIAVNGSYDTANDVWTFGTWEPSAATVPTKAIITITDVFGKIYTTETGALTETSGLKWADLFTIPTFEVTVLSSTRSNLPGIDSKGIKTINNFGWFAVRLGSPLDLSANSKGNFVISYEFSTDNGATWEQAKKADGTVFTKDKMWTGYLNEENGTTRYPGGAYAGDIVPAGIIIDSNETKVSERATNAYNAIMAEKTPDNDVIVQVRTVLDITDNYGNKLNTIRLNPVTYTNGTPDKLGIDIYDMIN